MINLNYRESFFYTCFYFQFMPPHTQFNSVLLDAREELLRVYKTPRLGGSELSVICLSHLILYTVIFCSVFVCLCLTVSTLIRYIHIL
jgi:hypothetical protein